MAAGISLELIKAVQLNQIKCRFAGVALGDSWISPLDSVLSWGPYLYSINTDGVNFYNIMTKQTDSNSPQIVPLMRNSQLVSLYNRHIVPLQSTSLDWLMNGPIRKKLKIIPDFVKWGGQSNEVFSNMEGDFMRPVIDIIDKLLLADVNVTVYNGQLDLIVDTLVTRMLVLTDFMPFGMKRR
eukprot:g40786.t1